MDDVILSTVDSPQELPPRGAIKVIVSVLTVANLLVIQSHTGTGCIGCGLCIALLPMCRVTHLSCVGKCANRVHARCAHGMK